MKREGRQHGMVRNHTVVKLSSPATLVQPKPTNHSVKRSCGRPGSCLTCHEHHPTTKSKNKAKEKGANKLKSNDVLYNARLVSYRVVNEHHHHGLLKLKYSGFSASKILDQLENSYHHNSNSFYNDDHDDDGGGGCCEYSFNDDGVFLSDYIEKERERKIQDDELYHHDDDDDAMSFCELGYVMYDEIEGDEDWCLVAEIM